MSKVRHILEMMESSSQDELVSHAQNVLKDLTGRPFGFVKIANTPKVFAIHFKNKGQKVQINFDSKRNIWIEGIDKKLDDIQAQDLILLIDQYLSH